MVIFIFSSVLVWLIGFKSLLHYYDKKTKRKSKKPPQYAKAGMLVSALIETTAPICIERWEDYKMLGRFTLRDEGAWSS